MDSGTHTTLSGPQETFERLGQMREQLTDMQTLAADLDDTAFSKSVFMLQQWNLAAGEALTRLLQTERSAA